MKRPKKLEWEPTETNKTNPEKLQTGFGYYSGLKTHTKD